MRILILFLFVPFFLFAQPAKVVGVIPVKFNGKGLHAPVPYSQQIMERGWTKVPTYNVPFTMGGNARYQPTTMSKASIARGLGYLAGTFNSLNPATKTALLALGLYEANCISQNYPSLCMNGDPIQGGDPDDYDPADWKQARQTRDQFCSTWDNRTCGDSFNELASKIYPIYLNAKKSQNKDSPSVFWTYRTDIHSTDPNLSTVTSFKNCRNPTSGESAICGTWTENYPLGHRIVRGGQWVCPPIELVDETKPNDLLLASYSIGPKNTNRCHRPKQAFTPVPATPDFILDQMEVFPSAIDGLGPNDFIDPVTGAPIPDAFENPTFDPVSPAFADAAESIANGTFQHTNPSAPNYIPRDMMPNILTQINNWHEGNTFTDPFTNKEHKPDTPPPEKQKTDWTDFPGITKAQYDASNNAWGNAAVAGQPTPSTEIDKLLTEQQKLTDFINGAPPANPIDFNIGALLNLPTGGGCRGFTLDASINGQPKTIRVEQHCPPYNAWGQPVISWLLSIFTVLTCFQIFRRTLEVTP